MYKVMRQHLGEWTMLFKSVLYQKKKKLKLKGGEHETNRANASNDNREGQHQWKTTPMIKLTRMVRAFFFFLISGVEKTRRRKERKKKNCRKQERVS